MNTSPAKNKKKSIPAKKIAIQSPVAVKPTGEKGRAKQKSADRNPPKKSAPARRGPKALKPFTIVAIGASAGGLEAITQLLQNLSPTTGMAYIYVQHLSPEHKSMLSAILSKTTSMKVQDIEEMDRMKPDNVYVMPFNKVIKVTEGRIKLLPRPPNKVYTLPIDVLFSSLAESHKKNVIGIVLSGSATDGTEGLKKIKQAGGITFAQDDSAKFSSMPKSAIAEGVVDFILSPKEIAKKLNWISNHPLKIQPAVKKVPEEVIKSSDLHLKQILQLLLKKKNVDFSHYKINTIQRRILRRMLIHKMETLQQYAEFLEKKNKEVDLLYYDLLINVTEFFRDNDAFVLLKKTILPRLLKSKAPDEPLRIWVVACATGEEVYSIAMTLFEMQDTKTTDIPFQIFASDLSAEAINKARNGEYTIHQLKNISPKRLQRFFIKSKDKYRISKSLRDVCIFAQHNILRDPPFSRMDFISCRNLLIYFDNLAQKKVIALFHYALNEGGYLMLGKSETIGSSLQLFTPSINKKYKIYSRKKNSGVHRIPEITAHFSQERSMQINQDLPEKNTSSDSVVKRSTSVINGNIGTHFDAVLLAQYVPASVVISYDLEILQFRGPTSMYLQHSPGKASFNILKMVHTEISFELRNAIHTAIKTKQPVRKAGIEINRNKPGLILRLVDLKVAPLKIEGEYPLLIIVFTGEPQMKVLDSSDKSGKNDSLVKDKRIQKLEAEIAAARYDMASIIQDQDAANEELQSANEEIVSSNEELQSLNEELETSKEEIESTNEELITTNQELNARIQQVEELYNYYETILSTIYEPMLILEKDMRIKSANHSFCKMFHVTPEESIGVSLYKLGNSQWNIPRLRRLLEEIVPENNHFQDFEVEHTFPVIGKKTMLLNAHRIIQQSKGEELIVLTISDITRVKRLAIQLQVKEKRVLEIQLESKKTAMTLIEESNKRYAMMLMQSPFAFAILKGKDMVITFANDSIKEIWGKGTHIEGKALLKVLPEIKNGTLPALLDKVLTTGIPHIDYEELVSINRKGKSEQAYFNFVYQPYLESDESISGVTIIAYEVTAHVSTKAELIQAKNNAEQKTQIAEDAVKSKQQFLSNMSHEIRTPMNAIIGFTNVVLKTKLDASQKEYINAIKVAGDALIILINDILDLSKVNAGKMIFEKTPFNLKDSIATMLLLFEPKIREKNLDLLKEYDATIPKMIVGDPMRLRQIILNLMSNAVKFTKEGKIVLSVHMLKEDIRNVTLEFAVTDTGIGISKDKLELIFNNFEQGSKDTSSSFGGTGLGLAISKQLVEMQGGTIMVASNPGKGSTFGFILSFEKTNATIETSDKFEALSPVVPEATASGNIRVLVAEDVVLNQLLIKIIVADFGFDIDIAANGKMAIEKMQHNTYDIILMDLQMPEMNGFEATKFIRNNLHSDIPIIALTADVTTADVEKCKAVGMNDYISKPIDEKLLHSKIMNQLMNRH